MAGIRGHDGGGRKFGEDCLWDLSGVWEIFWCNADPKT